MRTTHKVSPLKAYDVDYDVIHPEDYRSKLAGALVEIIFTMTHWPEPNWVGIPTVDIYVADIVGIRVLAKPGEEIEGKLARKRRIPQMLTPDIDDNDKEKKKKKALGKRKMVDE